MIQWWKARVWNETRREFHLVLGFTSLSLSSLIVKRGYLHFIKQFWRLNKSGHLTISNCSINYSFWSDDQNVWLPLAVENRFSWWKCISEFLNTSICSRSSLYILCKVKNRSWYQNWRNRLSKQCLLIFWKKKCDPH